MIHSYCVFDDTIPVKHVSDRGGAVFFSKMLTLHIGDALLEDLLQIPRILQLFGNFANNALSQFPLLPLLDLALVSSP